MVPQESNIKIGIRSMLRVLMANGWTVTRPGLPCKSKEILSLTACFGTHLRRKNTSGNILTSSKTIKSKVLESMNLMLEWPKKLAK